MTNIYAPLMRALVVVALVLATATLMFVAVNTARAATLPVTHIHPTTEILVEICGLAGPSFLH